MGKAGKLFKFFGKNEKAGSPPQKTVRKKKGSKDKCLWSLGKSSSRRRDIASGVVASPLDIVEIKTVQVQNSNVKEPPSLITDSGVGGKISSVGVLSGCGGPHDALYAGPLESIKEFSPEDCAAVKIQAAVRCFLGKRAFRALRALIKVQALIRGRIIRNHAAASLQFMRALVRIQALARGRRIRSSELGQLVHKHLLQVRQQKKKPVEGGWVSSIGTLEQLQAKAQSKQDAVMKRQRALVYSFTEQLNRTTTKHSNLSFDNKIDKSNWIWVWLYRWMAVFPHGSSSSVREQQEFFIKDFDKESVKPEIEVSVAPPSKQDGTIGGANEERLYVTNDQEVQKIATKEVEEIKIALTESGANEGPTHNNCHADLSNSVEIPAPQELSEEGTPVITQQFDSQRSQLCVTPAVVGTGGTLRPSELPEITLSGLRDAQSNLSKDNSRDIHPIDHTTEYYTLSCSSDMHPIDSIQKVDTAALSFGIDTVKTSERHAESPSKASISNLDSSSTFSLPELNSALQSGSPALLSPKGQPASSTSISGIVANKDLPSQEYIVEEDLFNSSATGATNGSDNGIRKCEPQSIDNGTSPADDVSEFNGCCDASVSAKSIEVSAKRLASPGSKPELQRESLSPSVPNYMIATKSAKAKARTLTSPKPKSESPKPKFESPKSEKPKFESPKPKFESPKSKFESPKQKLDSPKQKVDSPNYKTDSASKRRHSLSALDGKNSPGVTQKPVLHVRANSKGTWHL